MANDPPFRADRVVIWGVGLMGGSLGLALRQARAAEVIGLGRRPAPLAAAQRMGAVDRYTLDPDEALAGGGVVVLGMPVATIQELAPIWGPRLVAGTLVTDVGSTKAEVVAAWEPYLAPGTAFVGGHPMCGSEKAGVEYARPDLYRGAPWVVTPTARTPAAAVQVVEAIAHTAGARVLRMDPAVHDQRVAFISHLPQLAAVAVAAAAGAGEADLGQVLALAAGGFRDTTRLALSPPELWEEILLTNRAPVLAALAEFRTALDGLEAAVRDGDRAAIAAWFQRAAAARSQIRT